MFDSGGQAKTVTHKPLSNPKSNSSSKTEKSSAKSAAQAQASKAKARALNEIKSAAKVVVRFVLAVTGIDDAVNCFTKLDIGGCVSTGVTILAQLVGVLAVKIAAKILIDGRRLYRLAVAAKNAIGRISSAVKRYKTAKAAEAGASAADRAALDYATSSAKLDHIFAAKHNFEPLVQQFGSREAVARRIVTELKGLTPESGTFEQQIVVGGQKVVVRGAVVNGVAKIGTAFMP